MAAMRMLKTEYGDRFAQVFKTITVDNGSDLPTLLSAKTGAPKRFRPSLHFMGTGAK